MKCKKPLFAFMLMLMLTCNLNAQEVSSEKTNQLDTVLAETLDDADEELDSAVESDDSASEDEDEGEVDELAEVDELDEDELDEDESDEDELDEDELDEDELDEDESDEDELDDDQEEQQTGPVTISLNENGELVGQATADVGGDWVPVEANVALVANGVLLSKIVCDQDGSFAFPNVAPGDYNVCGAASSYCGQQAISVQCNCGDSVDYQDSVGLQLSQSAQSCCYSQLGSAPAATFADGSGLGFSSGGGGFAGGGGGGFATGGGAASGVSGLRLLTIGGIATAIAVGGSDDDDASPTN